MFKGNVEAFSRKNQDLTKNFEEVMKVFEDSTFLKRLEQQTSLGEGQVGRDIHFVVHPDFPWQYEPSFLSRRLFKCDGMVGKIEEAREVYCQAMKEVFEKTLYFVIQHPSEPFYNFCYKKEREVVSFAMDGNLESGFLEMDQFLKLLDLIGYISPSDKFTFHGSNFGECTLGFMLQFYCAIKLGILHPASVAAVEKELLKPKQTVKEQVLCRAKAQALFTSIRDTLALHRAFKFENRFEVGIQFDSNGQYLNLYEHPILSGQMGQSFILPHDILVDKPS